MDTEISKNRFSNILHIEYIQSSRSKATSLNRKGFEFSQSPSTVKADKKLQSIPKALVRSTSNLAKKQLEIRSSTPSDVTKKKFLVRLNENSEKSPKPNNLGLEFSLKTPTRQLHTFYNRSKSNPKFKVNLDNIMHFRSPQHEGSSSPTPFQQSNISTPYLEKFDINPDLKEQLRRNFKNEDSNPLNSETRNHNLKAPRDVRQKTTNQGTGSFTEHSPTRCSPSQKTRIHSDKVETQKSPNRVRRTLSKRKSRANITSENESTNFHLRSFSQSNNQHLATLKDFDSNEKKLQSLVTVQAQNSLSSRISFEDRVRKYVEEKTHAQKVSIMINLHEKGHEQINNSSQLRKQGQLSLNCSHRDYTPNHERLSLLTAINRLSLDINLGNNKKEDANIEIDTKNEKYQELSQKDTLLKDLDKFGRYRSESEKHSLEQIVQHNRPLLIPEEKNKNLEELVRYSKQKSKEIEDYILKEGKERAQHGGEDRFSENFAIANVIDLRGGSISKGLRNKNERQVTFWKEIEEIRETQSIIDQFRRMMMDASDIKTQQKMKPEIKMDLKVASSSKLTDDEIDFLKLQFEEKKSPDQLEFNKIDQILIRLKFFGRLEKEIRASFYKYAQYIKKSRGTYIFHQGDLGDLMYVILRGGVNVKIKKTFKDGQIQDVTIATLYDGSHFGELTIIDAKFRNPQSSKLELTLNNLNEAREILRKESQVLNKDIFNNYNSSDSTPNMTSQPIDQYRRTASIQCAEETEFLAIHREQFNELLYSIIKEDLHTKIRIVQSLPFFKSEEPLSLLPIVNNLKEKKYKNEQKVIEVGDIIMDFFILVRGKCKIIHEFVTEAKYDIVAPRLDSKLQTLNERSVGRETPLNNFQSRLHQKNKNSSVSPVRRTDSKDSLFQESGKNSKKQVLSDYMVFRNLTPGDHFGFRSLLNPDIDAKYREKPTSKAKLAIVADSPEVEIFTFSREFLPLIPEPLKNTLLEGLSKETDFDDYDIENMVQAYQDEKQYQKALIKNIFAK